MKKTFVAMLLMAAGAAADEGMWLYNRPPATQLKQTYQFEAPQSWYDHLMQSSVRFNSGGSGSFVSADGLVMTNHHVAADAIQKLSSAQRDLIKDGYIAGPGKPELPCLDLELNVLQSIEDVTAKIQAAVPAGVDSEQAEKARRAAINTLEQSEGKSSGLRCDVVTLYRGGAYHLYRYKRYTDVRLAFAPEIGIAFHGGDVDNFEYPRHCLDVTFFRVYENNKPVQVQHFLRWSNQGVKEGDLVFVSGHPGRTNRLNTVSHLKFFRDHQYPSHLDMLRRWEVLLGTYGERSAENRRQAQDERFGVQNGRKARTGGLQGLQDPAIWNAKVSAEQALRQQVQSDPSLSAKYAGAWTEIDKAIQELQRVHTHYLLFEQARAFNSDLFHKARVLVRAQDEWAKPNAQRLREYSESGKQSLEQDLFSPAPIYPALDEVKLADSLAMLVDTLGGDAPEVARILAGKSPKQRARELVQGTRVGDVAERKRLLAEPKAQDPMVDFARLVDSESRNARSTYEKKVAEPLEQAYAKIARAKLESAQGAEVYPDATFTLRLSYGKVAGYQDGNQQVPFTTTFDGLFKKAEAHQNQAPFTVPQSWEQARQKGLTLTTPYNFLSTVDIIGGNSGSPVVNRQGEVVGLIFDGNLDSLSLDFLYSDRAARALSVDSRAITTALRQVYNCAELANEIEKGGR